ncbi:adenosine-deaminase [Whalleya microplaca]|nr:adenosine-deaminase [Whalleya microplaca]
MTVTPDQVASLVLKQYDALPAKRKPVVRGNGVHEWVPLSGIVAEDKDGKLYCLALATGMKCLPASKLPQAQGNVLHDWHAEVLAIRAFNRFVLDECKALASTPTSASEFLRWRTPEEKTLTSNGTNPEGNEGEEGEEVGGTEWHGQPFAWREDVSLHMYCSEAPCGDASMELTMAAQADATPWAIPIPASTTVNPDVTTLSAPSPSLSPIPSLPGRAYFSALGIPRRKPARGDAPPTLSKSCSDKLSFHACTSLLSSITTLLVSPDHAYLHSLILPSSQHSATGSARAFAASGRMGPVSGRAWGGGYAFRGFDVQTFEDGSSPTPEFTFSKCAVTARASGKTAASNLATAWTRSGQAETTLGGVQQGRRPFDARGASFASRRRMWALAAEVAGLLATRGNGDGGWGVGVEVRRVLEGAGTYGEVKGSGLLGARRRVKEEVTGEALKGWVRNVGDEDFAL